MRKAIKIGVILLVLAAIVFIVVMTFRKTDDSVGDIVTKTNLVKNVEQRADDEIVDKTFAEAKQAFTDVMNMIKTEEGQGNYSTEEIEQSRQIAVRDYAPIFADDAISYYSISGWGGAKVGELRVESQQLLAYNMIETGSPVYDKLKKVIEIAGKYAEAKGVVAAAGGCYTVEAAQSCKNRALSLIANSYISRSDMRSRLEEVPRVAKNACAGAIKSTIGRLVEYDDYGDAYLSGYNEEKARNLLNSYYSAFGDDDNYKEISSYIYKLT